MEEIANCNNTIESLIEKIERMNKEEFDNFISLSEQLLHQQHQKLPQHPNHP